MSWVQKFVLQGSVPRIPMNPSCMHSCTSSHLVYGDEHAGHVVFAGHDAGQLPLEVDDVADLLGATVSLVIVAVALVQKGDDAREVFEERRRALRVGVTVELLRGESDSSCKSPSITCRLATETGSTAP